MSNEQDLNEFLAKKTTRSILEDTQQSNERPVKNTNPYILTTEEINLLRKAWGAKNYNDLNNWCQRVRCHLEFIQVELLQQTIFHTTVLCTSKIGLFENAIVAEGDGPNKKESKTAALRNLTEELIKRNLIHYGMPSHHLIGYRAVPTNTQEKTAIKESPLVSSSSSISSINVDNESKKISSLMKAIALSNKTNYVQNYQLLKELKLLKHNLEWLEISYLWYYGIVYSNLNFLQQILDFTFGVTSNDVVCNVQLQIKDEMIKSIIFCEDSKFSIGLLNAFNSVVSYTNEYLQCEAYYHHFRHLFYIELLDILSHTKANCTHIIDSYGSIALIGNRFSQLIITFTSEYNSSNISKQNKEKLIANEEIVYIENNTTKEASTGLIQSITSLGENKMQAKIRINQRQDITCTTFNKTDTYRIIKIMNLFIFNRTLDSLKSFCLKEPNTSLQLKKIIYGSFDETISREECYQLAEEEVCKLPQNHQLSNIQLNSSQKIAIQSALKQRLTLIQGPAGTGKTTAAIELVIEWLKLDKSSQILLCAESNCAVDLLYNELLVAGVPAYRYGWKDKDNAQREPREFEFSYIKKRIDNSHVICTTCVGAANEYLKDIQFKRVIIDEATQASEVSVLIPLIHNCQQLILIGDHKQLPPTVISYQAQIKGLGKSLFERLVNYGLKSYMLEMQYRMHSSLSAFPSKCFYEGKIQNGIPDSTIPIIKGINWPINSNHIGFIDIKGKEELDGTTHSFFNQIEINEIMSLLLRVIQSNNISIGIITPYDSQKKHLIDNIKQTISFSANIKNSLTVDTVDGFQGMEKDLIIVSLVRSNNNQTIGFLSDTRRMNVLLTRARCGLIVIGNSTWMKSNKTWNEWMEYIDSNKYYITN